MLAPMFCMYTSLQDMPSTALKRENAAGSPSSGQYMLLPGSAGRATWLQPILREGLCWLTSATCCLQDQKVRPALQEKLERRSRYIENLKDKAKEREKEQGIVYERRCGPACAPVQARHDGTGNVSGDSFALRGDPATGCRVRGFFMSAGGSYRGATGARRPIQGVGPPRCRCGCLPVYVWAGKHAKEQRFTCERIWDSLNVFMKGLGTCCHGSAGWCMHRGP